MVYLALHNVHQPVESPEEFVALYPAEDYNAVSAPTTVLAPLGLHSSALHMPPHRIHTLHSLCFVLPRL